MRGPEDYYYPNTLKKMVVACLNIFKGVVVYKYNKSGEIIEKLEVPVIFGTQKALHKARTNDEQKQYVPTFPRIEVALNGLTPDEARLVSPNTTRFFNIDDVKWKIVDEAEEILTEINGAFQDFMPLPYNYNFTVNVYTESMDYLSQIIENVFPYFGMTNSTMRIREFDFLNIERDINITIGSPEMDLAGEVGQGERRQANTNFTIMLEGWMYRPVKSSKILKTIDWSLSDPDFSQDRSDHIEEPILDEDI